MIQTPHDWVMADDRLPTESETDDLGFVLVAFEGGGPGPFTALCAEHNGEVWVDRSNFVVHQVVCWTPIPIPPPSVLSEARQSADVAAP